MKVHGTGFFVAMRRIGARADARAALPSLRADAVLKGFGEMRRRLRTHTTAAMP